MATDFLEPTTGPGCMKGIDWTWFDGNGTDFFAASDGCVRVGEDTDFLAAVNDGLAVEIRK